MGSPHTLIDGFTVTVAVVASATVSSRTRSQHHVFSVVNLAPSAVALSHDGLISGAGNDVLNRDDGTDWLFGGDFSAVGGSLPNSGDDSLNAATGTTDCAPSTATTRSTAMPGTTTPRMGSAMIRSQAGRTLTHCSARTVPTRSAVAPVLTIATAAQARTRSCSTAATATARCGTSAPAE